MCYTTRRRKSGVSHTFTPALAGHGLRFCRIIFIFATLSLAHCAGLWRWCPGRDPALQTPHTHAHEIHHPEGLEDVRLTGRCWIWLRAGALPPTSTPNLCWTLAIKQTRPGNRRLLNRNTWRHADSPLVRTTNTRLRSRERTIK